MHDPGVGEAVPEFALRVALSGAGDEEHKGLGNDAQKVLKFPSRGALGNDMKMIADVLKKPDSYAESAGRGVNRVLHFASFAKQAPKAPSS